MATPTHTIKALVSEWISISAALDDLPDAAFYPADGSDHPLMTRLVAIEATVKQARPGNRHDQLLRAGLLHASR